MAKSDVARLLAVVKEEQVAFSANPLAMRTSKKQLEKIKFTVHSDCNTVTVQMALSGTMTNLSIKDDARKRYQYSEMARLVTETIQEAEEIVEQVVAESARRSFRRQP